MRVDAVMSCLRPWGFVALAGLVAASSAQAAEERPKFSLARFQGELVAAKPAPKPAASTIDDPWEGWNRGAFAFNQALVVHVINPVARVLDKHLPQPVKDAGHNVYANLVEPEFIVTNMMVGRKKDAGVSTLRFAVNSTVGALGVWDPASRMGLKRNEVEFTEAMCAMGVPTGSYVVLPLVGPASAVPSSMLVGFFAVEWYALAMISSTIATADLVVDLSASAASLRNSRDIPDGPNDLYHAQRTEYGRYLHTACPVSVASSK